MPGNEWGEWQKLEANAKRNVLFNNFAQRYKSKHDIKVERLKNELKEIAPDHELIFVSDKLKDTKGYEYRCAVFIDHRNKQIVCANSGTRPKFNLRGFYDLIDDINLVREVNPNKLKAARKLNTLILQNLGDKIKDYELHYTGHSLGAAMADIQAADMYLQMQKQGLNPDKGISTVTFDNPGAKPIVDKMFQKANLDPAQSPINHNSFNNKKNFINTLNPQVGKTFEIKLDGQERHSSISMGLAAMYKFISTKLKSITPKFILKVLEKLSYGSISNQIKNHKLENFNEAFNGEGGEVRLISASLPKIRRESLSKLGENQQITK